MRGYLLLCAVVGATTFACVAGVSCAGHPQLPPDKLAICLFRMNDRLAGKTSCEDIVKAITSVVSEDNACSDLVFHNLKCENAKDGG